MNHITTNLLNNKKELLVVVSIQIFTAIGCYLMIPKLFS